MSARDLYITPTAKWPVMFEAQRKMLHAYFGNGLDKPSTYLLRILLPDVAKDFQQSGKEANKEVEATTRALHDPRGFMDGLLHLLWAIPEKMLLAILRQTVSVDFFNASEQFSELKEASGIYVVTIEMGGHSGRFLSSEQIAKAVDFLRMYEIGARHLKKFLSGAKQAFPSTLAGTEALLEQHFGIRDFIARCNEVNLTALPETDQATTATQSAIQEVIAFVDAMDNADIMSCPHEGLVRHDSRGKGARMSPAEDHAQSTSGWISDLIGMLTRRKFCIEGHADYRTHADQTPMYIGCSNDLEADIAKYTTSRIPSNINKSLQLLLSVLLLMEVDTVVKARVVLRTWEANQLQLAEQLVIALGRTVVWQDGFNSEEGGKTAGSDNSERLEAAEDCVTSSEWFKANTVATWIQGEAILKALDVGKAVFEATEGDIKAMTITRKRRQEISDVASSLPESVTGPLNEVADLLEARLARCKADMLMDLRNAFQVAVPGIGMKEKKPPSGTQ